MNIQEEVREALSGFIEKFGLSTFADLNIADLADLLVRLNGIEKAILYRIEVALDEKGEHTTEVFVKPGVTVEEDDLSISVPRGNGNVECLTVRGVEKLADELSTSTSKDGTELPVLFTEVTPEEFQRRIQEGLEKVRASFAKADKEADMIDRVLFSGLQYLAVDAVAPPFSQASPRLTLSGFIEYAKIRFGLGERGAVQVREILAEAIHARLKKNADKGGGSS